LLKVDATLQEESRIVAEAWKILDKAFVDKTFNGNDWTEVRKKYVRTNYKNTAEAYAAIREMTGLLGDRFTRFLTPAQYETLSNMYTSETPQAGVGVEMALDPESNQIKIVSVVPSSPAEKVGVKKGDLSSRSMTCLSGGSTPDDAASLLRGEDGSTVNIKLESKGKTRELVLTREILKATSVSSKLVPSPESNRSRRAESLSCPSRASSQVLSEAKALRTQGAKALLLDLRGNLGGYFPAGVDLAKVKIDVPVLALTSTQNGALAEVSLAVLVDHNTASAAEVLTAALQDNKRAGVIGEQTYGKGLVQTIARLQDGSALVITVAKYRTPLGQDINKVSLLWFPLDR
ncbi:hypothetical protein GUITHDRAFT_65305, partial [Guillardia theta CCMP2712]